MDAQAKISLPTYFDGQKIGKAHKRFLWIAAIAYAFDLMDNVIFSFVSPVLIASHGLTMDSLATLSSMFFIGMFIGGILGGWVADKYGRKFGLLSFLALFSLGSILNACWVEGMLFLLEFSRFLTGFGILGMTTISMSYISEMMPSENRGKYQSFTLAAGTISIPVISLIGSQVISASVYGWRILLVIGGLGIVLVPIGAKWLLESPRWLISKGRVADAEQVMERALGFPVDMQQAFDNYQLTCVRTKKVTTVEAAKMMFSKKQWKQTVTVALIVWLISFGQNMQAAYSTSFLTSMGFSLSLVLICSAVSAFGQPIGEFISGFFSDKGGRVGPVMIFCGGGGLCLIIAGMQTELIPIYVWITLKSVIGAGCMALMYTYLAESFPTDIRGIASGWIFSLARLFMAGLTFAVPMLFARGGWFLPNAVNGAIYIAAAVIAILFGRKTARKSLEELHCVDSEE